MYINRVNYLMLINEEKNEIKWDCFYIENSLN